MTGYGEVTFVLPGLFRLVRGEAIEVEIGSLGLGVRHTR